MKILITGGAGFIGSNLAIYLKEHSPSSTVICFDNLKRRGSELNLPRLKKSGIQFIHGDIRNAEDFQSVSPFDLMIECSAEPSVLAGITSSPSYVLNTNLMGTIHCLEEVRKNHASLIFLSTSRVYPFKPMNALSYTEEATRFSLAENTGKRGVTREGITEEFPLQGPRSVYGATKLCSEYLIQEYIESYGIRAIINRCGLIAGPWQMGKVDQGVVMLWVACHLFRKDLTYIGYKGTGKQVRDVLHVDDLCDLVLHQSKRIDEFNGEIFNVGGGIENSISLQEMTLLCKEITGETIPIGSNPQTRSNDLIWYISDISRVSRSFDWKPQRTVKDTIIDINRWLGANADIIGYIM
jgi:CDP-paratose 2-epimerase